MIAPRGIGKARQALVLDLARAEARLATLLERVSWVLREVDGVPEEARVALMRAHRHARKLP